MKFKTTIVFKVLHTVEDIEDWDLDDIVCETRTGSLFSGDIKKMETVEVSDEEMRSLLEAQRSDPDFFDDDEEVE